MKGNYKIVLEKQTTGSVNNDFDDSDDDLPDLIDEYEDEILMVCLNTKTIISDICQGLVGEKW